MQNQVFQPSRKHPLNKIRLAFWVGALAPVVLGFFPSGPSLGTTVAIAMLVLLFLLPLDWFLRGQARRGKEPVTLDDTGIASAQFSGPVKQLAWRDIESVALDRVQGTHLLKFQLKPSAGVASKRSFLSGADPSRPVLSLYFFEPTMQEQMLEAVNLRLHAASAPAGEAAPALHNGIAEQRIFEDRLKNLAPTPWVTYALIAANLAVWLMGSLHGSATLMRAPADLLLAWGGNAASEVQEGQWWRLLSAMFLHGGLIHVAMNMVGLHGAGVMVERIYGHGQFALIYFAAGLSGSALSLHFAAQHAVSVGASGAVFGVFGALLVAVFVHRDKLPQAFGRETLAGIGLFVVYSLAQGLGKQGIDNAAHVGGLIGGAVIAAVLPVRLDPERFFKVQRERLLAGAVLACTLIVALAWTAPQAAIDQSRVVASIELSKEAVRRFDAAIRALAEESKAVKAGTMSEIESDERSRAVHAPEFRRITDDLAQVVLRPGDPREAVLRDVSRISRLLAESLGMDSVVDPENGKITPADPERAAQIEQELGILFGKLKEHTEALKKTNQSSAGKPR